MTIFDILNDITRYKKKDLDKNSDFESVFDNYMVLRWLSMSDAFVGYVSRIEPYSTCYSKQELYRLLCDVLPKRKVFLKYIKKPKQKDHGGKQKQDKGN